MVRQRRRRAWTAAGLRWFVAAGGVAGLLAACATQVTVLDDDGGNNNAASSGSGTGGDGGSAQGGNGGEEVLPCGVDCSTITTPSCKVAVCDEAAAQCAVVDDSDGSDCDDGLFCTVDDACVAGLCEGGKPNQCGIEPLSCHTVVCNEDSNTCSETPQANGSSCTTNDLCQLSPTCTNGLCLGQMNDCFFAPVPSECYVAVCNPNSGMCDPQPGNFNQDCSDPNDLCTWGKTCDMAGACVGGGPADCSALTQGCFNGVCDAVSGQCIQQPVPPGGSCASAADDCNVGICDMNGACQPVPTNEMGVCEDGNACTLGETCSQGVCSGGVMVPPVVYFSESFADNSAGWTLGNEWAIGPALSSPSPGACGNGDPAADNTLGSDNGVAGVIIGGNAATALHAPYWITSPVVDTSTVNGALWLSYHRWLNSDYTPFMKNLVQVYDGSTWVTLWETGSAPGVQDASWAKQLHDISSYKNNVMQVRFGFEITSGGVFICAQWNLDDVVLSNVVCP